MLVWLYVRRNKYFAIGSKQTIYFLFLPFYVKTDRPEYIIYSHVYTLEPFSH